jgi:hypothetical protein
MNNVELHEAVREKPDWAGFAAKLKTAMTDEYRLEGVSVVVREMTAQEESDGEKELLNFNPVSQQFEVALSPSHKFPPAWRIADRIDSFLNPDTGGDG